MVVMRTTRIAAAMALAVAGSVLAGCGTAGAPESSSAEEPTNASSLLANLDPCKVLTQSELDSIGVISPGEFVDQGIGEPGCDYWMEGEYLLTIYKKEGDGLSYWEERKDNFAVFEHNKVGTRDGIKGVAVGSSGFGLCRQIMAAGDGTVSVAINDNSGRGASDEETCAKAMEIAQVVEPKLPK